MSEEMLTVVNPYNLQPIGSLPQVGWPTVESYLEQAWRLFRARHQWLPAYRRIEILERAAQLMEARQGELAFQIANEGGKPLIDARVEVARAIDGIKWCIRQLAHMGGEEIPMDLTAAGSGRIAFSSREPIGPVVAVSAFNHPLNLIVHQVAPAVAVGCPVLVKPAPDTPLSCRSFVEILYEAGLPEPWCRMVVCDIPTAERMITDRRVAFFSFIGSGQVGWMLRSKLAPGTRCALEHGGVAPVIVDQGADLEQLIPALLKGGFYHSGQVCVSVQRIFAPREMAEPIAEQLAAGATKLVTGNATEEATQCGPLIRPPEVKRVESWVDEAVSSGAGLLCGGKPLGETTYAPTVLLNPSHDCRLSTQEIFGPVVSLYAYDQWSEAISQANALPYAFQAAVFTQRLNVAMQAVQELDATAVMVNDHTAFRVDWMPFAGRRESGHGVGGIGHTMRDMTQDKMAVIRL
uniref:Putative NAD-dependent aldehyde dehydrogenases n=1 Tax=Magnetococcus massalia (strain MO-1) TaxID=451514 RepID=A0A1S7LE37_MAGMO|nr:Putative NAD-dependent aldehyde dehydrogenases [Candidatus Magnetococcus massalia]